MSGRRWSPFGTMRRALCTLVLIVLVPLVAVQAGIYWSWYHNRCVEEELANLEVDRAAAATIDAYVRQIVGQEQVIGHALAVLDPFSADRASADLLQATGEHRAVRVWSLADATGRVLASSDPRDIGRNMAGELPLGDLVRSRRGLSLTSVVSERGARLCGCTAH